MVYLLLKRSMNIYRYTDEYIGIVITYNIKYIEIFRRSILILRKKIHINSMLYSMNIYYYNLKRKTKHTNSSKILCS